MGRALRRRGTTRAERGGEGRGAATGVVAVVSLLALVLVAEHLLAHGGVGHLTRHMATHLLLMGLVAPPIAHLLLSRRGAGARPLPVAGALILATAMQIALLWGWHLPPLLQEAMASPLLHLLMQATLLLAAVWFWHAVLAWRGSGRWRAILALLVTGKLFCLLGVLLVFAPRALYAFGAAALGHAASAPAALADQQLAGLLMLVACPLTYVVAGVVVSARWLTEMGANSGPFLPEAAVAAPGAPRRE